MTLDNNDRETQNSSFVRPGNTTREPTNVIKATTPYPEIPIKAVVPDSQPITGTSADRFSVTTDVQPPKSEYMPPDFLGNNAPMVLFPMSDVNASMNTYMEFEIPNGLFYDMEDGIAYDMDMEVIRVKMRLNVECI